MTCVWDGIITALRAFGLRPMSAQTFAEKIKARNRVVENVRVNGRDLSPSERIENYMAIRGLNPATTGDGYDCSTSDPLLILVASVFMLDIHHDYAGVKIMYTYHGRGNRGAIHLRSDRGHLWAL